MDEQARADHKKYNNLIARAQAGPPTFVAVAHPCDHSALEGAVDAANLGLISPILVGPAERIQQIAQEFGLDISAFEIVDTPHSHASAEKAVELVRQAKASALMKGSLHTDELMAAVVKTDGGLRTGRRLSHCFVMDIPGHEGPLIITDAAINISPTLADKVDILQNAIDLAHALGFGEVRVAILSAVETINPKIPTTVEAGALCKMADRGQITGALIDGPLALDNAISSEAAAIKHLTSPVRRPRQRSVGAGSRSRPICWRRALTFLAGADAAGIVLWRTRSHRSPPAGQTRSCRAWPPARSRASSRPSRGGDAKNGGRLNHGDGKRDRDHSNAGSSSIKFSLFAENDTDLSVILNGQIEGLYTDATHFHCP